MKGFLKPKWILPLVIGILLTSTLALSLLVGSSRSQAASDRVVHVFEHATPDSSKLIVVGTNTDVRGNYKVMYEPVFDSSDRHQIGHSTGVCVYTRNTVQLCQFDFILPDGQITTQGYFLTTGTSETWAITGGTGSYLGAKGYLFSHIVTKGTQTEFEDFFHLV